MSCNTFIPIMDLVREVEALLAANYIDKDDPRITGGVFTNPTIKEGFLLDVQAREEFCRLVQECGLEAPFGKMWLSRPLYPDQMFVSYEDSGEPQTKWKSIQAVLESAGVLGPEATSLSSRLAAEIQRAEEAEAQLRDEAAATALQLRAETSALSSRVDTNASELAAEIVRATEVDSVTYDKLSTLEVADSVLQGQIDSIGGGKKAYATEALMLADAGNIAANSSIDVTNDPDPDKNGTYSYDGTTFSKSAYDPQSVILSKAVNSFGTKVLMEASSSRDGTRAVVTDDSVLGNNGFYVKAAAGWKKTIYDTPVIRSLSAAANWDDINTAGIFTTARYSTSAPTGIEDEETIGTLQVYPNQKQVWSSFRSMETWERVGNGGSVNFAWRGWRQTRTKLAVDMSANIFTESSLDGTTNAGVTMTPEGVYEFRTTEGLGYVFYPITLAARGVKAGDGLRLEAEVFSSLTGLDSSADISIRFYKEDGESFAITPAFATKAGVWDKLVTELTVPEDASYADVRLVRRAGVVRMKNIRLYSNAPAASNTAQTKLNREVSQIHTAMAFKVESNLMPSAYLTPDGASTYQGVLNSAGELEFAAGSIKAAFYDFAVDGRFFAVGDTVVFTAWAKNATSQDADISVDFLDHNKKSTSSEVTKYTGTGQWQELTVSRVILETAKYVRVRLIGRGATISYFRRPSLKTTALAAVTYRPNTNGAAGARTLYVSKNGSDTNDGTGVDRPLKSISAALTGLVNGGDIVVMDSEPYRESLAVPHKGTVRIMPLAKGAVNLFGSDKLEVTKTAGYTKVYEAALAAKPVGMGGARGKPLIAEWGTPSKPIPDAERHYLHHGLSHRLPYTEMFEATSIAEVEANKGVWFWEAGKIYLSATDGTDAVLKRYEARTRPVLTHTGGHIELIRVNSWFSSSYGMEFNGLSVKRSSCTAWGAYHNGFADNANINISNKDRSGGNGNDGFNCTFSPSQLGSPEYTGRIEAIYFDPYGHDNGDDGFSCHYRSDGTVYGGLFEHNTKADVVHVTGASCACYGTMSRGTARGFYSATNPDLDSERGMTTFNCHNTIAINNGTSYLAVDNSVMNCYDTKSIDPVTVGYSQTGTAVLNVTDGTHKGTAPAKSGDVTVISTERLI